ncbi:MAG: hypothetical protein H0T71_02645 [Acidobacteria bacterium]|nr:hypothetical protein [Acidobacteriota bacterium]
MQKLAADANPELPSLRQLWRATALAALVAGILLVTIILPSEYGRDPTGIGRRIGLYRPADPVAESVAISDALNAERRSTAAPLQKSTAPFRSDELSIVLKSGEGTERKAVMGAGQTMVFSWTATGGGVDVDMHGEAVNAAEGEFISYWKDEGQERGHGTLTAPQAGLHGWFWQNLNDTPVTITLKISGYYERVVTP